MNYAIYLKDDEKKILVDELYKMAERKIRAMESAGGIEVRIDAILDYRMLHDDLLGLIDGWLTAAFQMGRASCSPEGG